jgi:transposase
VICDNARHYRSKQVNEYLKDSKIKLIFLPPYSPNLNLIERYWKYFKKNILYDTYYATFNEFRYACEDFFADCCSHVEQLRSLLTENLQILGN